MLKTYKCKLLPTSQITLDICKYNLWVAPGKSSLLCRTHTHTHAVMVDHSIFPLALQMLSYAVMFSCNCIVKPLVVTGESFCRTTGGRQRL